jgi:Holliday junction resolvase
MEIKRKYFDKYLHSMAIDQIAREYSEKGYTVSAEQNLGKYKADLIAKKENETIVIEVKSGKMTPEKKKTIKQLGDYVQKQGNYRFLVAIATPPKEKKLEIENIEKLLFDYVLSNLPDELDELSTHTRIEEISDVDIDEIELSENLIFVKGSGVISVELQFGSDGDRDRDFGFKNFDNFPFVFELTLEYKREKLQIVEVGKFKVDTSSYD